MLWIRTAPSALRGRVTPVAAARRLASSNPQHTTMLPVHHHHHHHRHRHHHHLHYRNATHLLAGRRTWSRPAKRLGSGRQPCEGKGTSTFVRTVFYIQLRTTNRSGLAALETAHEKGSPAHE